MMTYMLELGDLRTLTSVRSLLSIALTSPQVCASLNNNHPELTRRERVRRARTASEADRERNR
jgi:hypothetical protein